MEISWECPHDFEKEIDLDDWRGKKYKSSPIPSYVSGKKPASPWQIRNEGVKTWDRNEFKK